MKDLQELTHTGYEATLHILNHQERSRKWTTRVYLEFKIAGLKVTPREEEYAVKALVRTLLRSVSEVDMTTRLIKEHLFLTLYCGHKSLSGLFTTVWDLIAQWDLRL
jgi:hypothetical protein